MNKEELVSLDYETECNRLKQNLNGLPDDIGKPIKSKVDFFPSHKGCKDFEWD